jgi:hypothetical protein
MNFNALKDLSREQLVELAGKQGLSVHHKAKPETIVKQIMDNTLVQQTPHNMQHPAEKVVAPVVKFTPEQVEEAIASIKARVPAFQSSYTEDNWHFKCNGAEEVGNLAIPLRVIVMKAGNVSKGRRMMRRLTDFGDINNSPNNAYTNSVLTF